MSNLIITDRGFNWLSGYKPDFIYVHLFNGLQEYDNVGWMKSEVQYAAGHNLIAIWKIKWKS
jgi:hypothetical protein